VYGCFLYWPAVSIRCDMISPRLVHLASAAEIVVVMTSVHFVSALWISELSG